MLGINKNMIWLWVILAVSYAFSIVLLEVSMKKLSAIKNFYKDKPEKTDVMRRYDIGNWSRPRLYIGAILLVPRVALIIFSVLSHYAFTKISMIGYKEQEKPLNPIRRLILTTSSRFWARVLLLGAGFWRIKTVGAPSDCCIISANHCSWIDIIYFLTSPELPSFVSKASVKSFPCVGLIATAMQCIFIERTSDKDGALKAIQRRQKILFQGFPKLLVFPEGTTTNGTGLMPFKRGGFIELLPVQPIVIKYEQGSFSPCMEIVPMLAHVVMLTCQFSNSMTVCRLPVVHPKQGWTPEEYAEHVRGIIAEFLKVPKVNFNIEEKANLITQIFNEKPKEF